MLRSFSLSIKLLWRACTLLCALALIDVACARRQRADDVKYPPRPPRCGLLVFYAEVPAIPAWDDIGTLEIICHIDDSEATCFSRVHAEACRMGGNILYRLPKRVWRPREEVFGYRGMVAHTRLGPDHAPATDPDAPAPASAEEAAGPVVPLTGPAAPGTAPDAGMDGSESGGG